MLLLWLLQMLADLVLPALMLCVCSRSSKSESVLGTIDQWPTIVLLPLLQLWEIRFKK
jgi:hypothetical protein